MQRAARYLNRSAFVYRSRRVSLVVLALAGLALAHGVARAAPSTAFTIVNTPAPDGGVTTDVFDFSQGARVYSASATEGNDSVRDILGASTAGNFGPGHTIFADGDGATRNLHFRTASLMTLTRYELRTAADPGTWERDLKFVRVWGSADNITWTDFGSTAVANPYNTIPGVTLSAIRITGTVTDATPAQFYRLEVQNGGLSGVRIVELDGFGTAPKTWAGGLVRDPVVFNAAANGLPSNSRLDEDPGYVVNITSSATLNDRTPRTAFGGYAVVVEPYTLLFSDGGTPDNGNQTMGDGGETVRWLQWQTSTNLPAPLAGVRLNGLGTDRSVELIRFSINGTAVTLFNGSTLYDHNKGGTLDLMFQTPRSIPAGTTLRLELTGGESNGPRLSEIDALLLYPPILPKGTAIMIR